MACSVCSKELYYDEGPNYENQKTGKLFCARCKPADEEDLLKLNGLEAKDAGILHAATRMRVPSSTPNRRAPGLAHHLKPEASNAKK